MTTKVDAGSLLMMFSRSFRGVRDAVGLLGLQMYTRVVEALAHASMPARSWAKAGVRRTGMTSVDPQPRSTCSGFTLFTTAIRSTSPLYSIRGYRFALPREHFMTSATL